LIRKVDALLEARGANSGILAARVFAISAAAIPRAPHTGSVLPDPPGCALVTRRHIVEAWVRRHVLSQTFVNATGVAGDRRSGVVGFDANGGEQGAFGPAGCGG
jgi:hypothetical protein